MIIDLKSITEQCKKQSAFAAREAADKQGESLFEKVLIMSQDEDFVTEAIYEALRELEAQCVGVVVSDNGEWTIIDEDRRNTGLDIGRPIVNYVMSRWLEDKVPEMSERYAKRWQTQGASVIREIMHKGAPIL